MPTPLFEAPWLRIVLDEAQNIKNHKAKCSRACFLLAANSVSRWCLTGTPLQNDAYEMFSLVHFLRIQPFDEFQHFKEKIGEPLKSNNQNRVNWGMKRLCFLLQTIMLRRTKEANSKMAIVSSICLSATSNCSSSNSRVRRRRTSTSVCKKGSGKPLKRKRRSRG